MAYFRTFLVGTAFLCAASASHAQTFTTIASFNGTNGANPGSQGGADITDGIIQDAAGTLYGTTPLGGTFGNGLIYKVVAGTIMPLYNFNGPADGKLPGTGLTFDSHGHLWGTTLAGGTGGFGTLFRLAGKAFAVKHTFCTGGDPCVDGGGSSAAMILGRDGKLWGVNGGPFSGGGTAFNTTQAGAFKTVFKFNGGPNTGFNPYGGLLQAADGNFYGTTHDGGTNDTGVIFRLTPHGAETVLLSFNGNTGDSGGNPAAALVQDASGNFYGTTTSGGTPPNNAGEGTVFKAVVNGNTATISNLHAFVAGVGDGIVPSALVLVGRTLYGITAQGSVRGGCQCGTIYAINLDTNSYQIVHNFNGTTDGANPVSLSLGSDGALYGMTAFGGANTSPACGARADHTCGTIFRLSLN